MARDMGGSEETYDVVVIGCGPAGAVAAHQFGKAGLKTLVVEREGRPYPLPRAVHLDHEMMRIFQDLGLVEELEPMMRATHGHVHIGADGGVIRYLGAHGRPKRFGWSNDYFFYQPELEATLRAGLSRYPNVELRLGRELTGLAQDEDGVSLTFLRETTGTEHVRAQYVLACDGARSTTRRTLGIHLDDLKFEEPWLVVDAEVEGPVVFPNFAGLPAEADLQNLSVMLCDPRRPTTIVPGRGAHRRWEFMLLPGENDQAMMAPERVAELVAPWLVGTAHRIIRAATYRFHGLVAEQWRVGRVLLAGDAAHQTPPFFGQGMCHGLRDVTSAAWKLKLVIEGKAGADLLDTYQTERDPHVRAVIGAAVEAGRYICMLDPEAAAERDVQLRAKTQTGVHTAADLIPPIRDGVVRPGSGERFIQPRMAAPDGREGLLDDLSGGGFRLLTLGSDPLSAIGAPQRDVIQALGMKLLGVGAPGQDVDLIDSQGDLQAWLQERGASAVLLRPDFYVYGVAATADEVADLLTSLGEDLRLTVAGVAQLEAVACPT
jgi:3-(3-hydroxy-phenyl)propionate hydroxylase